LIKVAILGAGPTGLGAGFTFKQHRFAGFKIFEKAAFPGGNCASFVTPGGFTYDLGGHVLFSHDPYFYKLLELALQKDYLTHNRRAFIYYKNRFIAYPFQNNLHFLPKEIAYECLEGIYRANLDKNCGELSPKNFREWLLKTFGKGLCEHFFFPYNRKVWATPLQLMGFNWIAERVSVPEFEAVLKTFVMEKKDSGWGPNSQFRYPLQGGVGDVFRKLAELVGKNKISYQKDVIKIDAKKKIIYFSDQSSESYQTLITTLPLNYLLRIVQGLPSEITALAEKFIYNSVYCVGLGVKGKCPSDKHWLYFPEKNFPFYRVSYLSGYSPNMAPDKGYFSLLCETAFSPDSPLKIGAGDVVKAVIKGGLMARYNEKDLVEIWEKTSEYAYCVPFKGRDEVLEKIIPELEKRDIYSVGRFGLWKYEIGNTDHSVLQGKALAERLLPGLK